MKTILEFNSINSFVTERLFAKKVTANDLEKFLLMHTHEEVMRTLGGIRNEEQSLDNLNWNLKQWEENGFGLWMFYLKGTQEWIGRGGLRRIEIDKCKEVEVGYALMPKFWNQGLATEITKACLEIAFEILRLNDVVCFTWTTNKASQRVMEKCGFIYERNFMHADLPHVLYRIKNYRKVELVPYDKNWPKLYEKESQKLKDILGIHLKEIHHIGSTAIPHMPTKPVIDIMLEFDNLDDIEFIKEKLKLLNYHNLSRHVIPHRSFFARRQEKEISYHLHIRERGDPQIKRHVHFRDYLIHHPKDADAYTALKTKLAAKHAHDIYSYVFGKDKLVQEIDRKAKLWHERKQDFLPFNPGSNPSTWTHEKIIKAMEANLNVHVTHFAQYINPITLIRIPGFTLINSGLNDDTFNMVLEADFSKQDADTKIREVILKFSTLPFSWWVSPYDKPDDLSDRLIHAGLTNAENNIGMYINLDGWTPRSPINHLKIVKVTNKKGLQDFARVLVNDQKSYEQYYTWIAEVYTSDDPIEFYVGYVNDKPVTRGEIVYFAQVAGLYAVSTATDERRKGYGTAIERFLLQRAKELGFHMAVLQASPEGLPLYLKQGFVECGTFKEFKPQ